MMKKFKVIFMMLCLCAGLVTGLETSAETKYVYDQADLLTEDEEVELQSYAEVMKDVWEMNFMVVTTDTAEGKSSMEYADDFYDTYFQDEDGMLYLIDMDNREIYLSTAGLAIRYLTDDRIESVLDEAFEAIANGDYYGTFTAFFDGTEKYLNEGIPEDQHNYDTETGEIDYYYDSEEEEDLSSPMRIDIIEFMFAIIAAIIPSGITVLIIKLIYRKKNYKKLEYDAYTDGEVKLTTQTDLLINQFVTHRRIPKNNGNSGSGGGGRSSVHRSSSGSSHGGGGRSF